MPTTSPGSRHFSWRHVFVVGALTVVWALCTETARCQDSAPQPEPHAAAPMTVPAEFMLPDVRLELRRGGAAPFDGVLFDAPTLVRWTSRILWLERRLQLEHDLHVALEAATRESYQTLVTRLTDSYEREIAEHIANIGDLDAALVRANARVSELERRPPHRAFAIGMGLGVGLSILTVGISAYALR